MEILPAATVGALTYDMYQFGLCILGIISFGNGIDTPSFGIVIVIWLPDCPWIELVSSALGVFIRDLSQLASFSDLLCSISEYFSASKAQSTAPVIWEF